MKTLLVPTDFSPIAKNASDYAFEMARSIEATVVLAHVYSLPVAISEVPVVVISEDEVRKNAERQLADLKKEYEAKYGEAVKVYTELMFGAVEDELEDLCKKLNPLAVVMATKGAGGLERIVFGSNTLTAIKHLTVPVIVVPPNAKFKKIENIGFATDFKNVKEVTPKEEIELFTRLFNAKLHILNIDFKDKHFTAETPEESLNLETMLEDLSPEFHHIEEVDFERAINHFADENKIDMVLLVPRKHKLLDSLFGKSHSKEMALHTRVPMMAVHH